MAKFIELTQHIVDTLHCSIIDRKVRINIEHIDFFYDRHIVFNTRAINVLETYDEITKLLENQQYKKKDINKM